MATTLIRNARLVATMDDAGTEIPDGAILIEDRRVARVGATSSMPANADVEIDASGMVILPGLVNTHHHFFQTLTRAIPAAQDADLFTWLRTLYPIWAGMTPEAIAVSTKIALSELLLSGCTTASDHTYIWPNGARVDDQIAAAVELGVRFHASRGSMSVGESRGGLPPDRIVENEDAILADSRRVIEAYHDPHPGAMIRIVLAPCSPFSVSPDLMRESVALARSYGVHSHTHLAETLDEAEFCQRTFGRSPVELSEDLGWVGDDVWHAHLVHPAAGEIARLGRTQTGAAHCPTSNMRLGSGVAAVGAWIRSGMRVGLGVDGSASNDGSHLLAEARMAMLLQRVGGDPAAMTAREALRLATRGGAAVLGRDDIGILAPGMMADLIGIRIDTLPFAGAAVHDPLAAIVFCQPPAVDLSIVNGRVRVRDGSIVGFDLAATVARHNAIAVGLARGELATRTVF
ncbi:MAG: Guanine deaminase; Hydroxydechloroatrazine ethylaminohydrolase [uncultured Thermomicrobiales bacterium]|uniref:Guanine deaminase Hydroxydechloroatrazine ethylaminohydrolase n=1 Tax=uncultured Thermomicrobiales bacterium TaxID=1645740 RepID=A0A6J4U7F0_9BACT|nr:MAG: Guanine deaminase; Hydroxydechloroatrazine ethylaminohydrolase [uncultured Thermomicrobiales bacterium]